MSKDQAKCFFYKRCSCYYSFTWICDTVCDMQGLSVLQYRVKHRYPETTINPTCYAC